VLLGMEKDHTKMRRGSTKGRTSWQLNAKRENGDNIVHGPRHLTPAST